MSYDECFVGGADPHKRSISIGVVDRVGREVAVFDAANDADGIDVLIDALRSHRVHRVGVEGSSGHGLQFASALVAAGFDVREVPARRTAQRRRERRRPKTDHEDAWAIARATAGDDSLGPARAMVEDAVIAELAVVYAWRADLVRRRKVVLNTAEAALGKLPVGLLDTIGRHRTVLSRLKQTVGLQTSDTVGQVQLARIAEFLADHVELSQRINQLNKQIRRLVIATNSTLRDEVGIDWVNAAGLLVEVGDPFRFHDEAAFARWCGVGAVAVSSGEGAGEPVRHRLDLGGNRRVNSMLYTMSITQGRVHDDARRFLARKRTDGKTPKEARRAHKRRLADRVIRRMWADAHQHTKPHAA